MRNLSKNKYRAKRVFEDGYLFDSMLESRRYRELKLLQKANEIVRIEVHPRYSVIWPGQTERICFVELDFRYQDKDGKFHVEDVKGFDTALSKLKRKLVEHAFGITVELIR